MLPTKTRKRPIKIGRIVVGGLGSYPGFALRLSIKGVRHGRKRENTEMLGPGKRRRMDGWMKKKEAWITTWEECLR